MRAVRRMQLRRLMEVRRRLERFFARCWPTACSCFCLWSCNLRRPATALRRHTASATGTASSRRGRPTRPPPSSDWTAPGPPRGRSRPGVRLRRGCGERGARRRPQRGPAGPSEAEPPALPVCEAGSPGQLCRDAAPLPTTTTTTLKRTTVTRWSWSRQRSLVGVACPQRAGLRSALSSARKESHSCRRSTETTDRRRGRTLSSSQPTVVGRVRRRHSDDGRATAPRRTDDGRDAVPEERAPNVGWTVGRRWRRRRDDQPNNADDRRRRVILPLLLLVLPLLLLLTMRTMTTTMLVVMTVQLDYPDSCSRTLTNKQRTNTRIMYPNYFYTAP